MNSSPTFAAPSRGNGSNTSVHAGDDSLSHDCGTPLPYESSIRLPGCPKEPTINFKLCKTYLGNAAKSIRKSDMFRGFPIVPLVHHAVNRLGLFIACFTCNINELRCAAVA